MSITIKERYKLEIGVMYIIFATRVYGMSLILSSLIILLHIPEKTIMELIFSWLIINLLIMPLGLITAYYNILRRLNKK